MPKKITLLWCGTLGPNSQVGGGRKKSRPIAILSLFYPPSDPQLLKIVSILLTVLVLYDNKFMLSEATKCVVICYSSNRKLIQQAILCFGKEFNLSIMESLEHWGILSKGAM